MTTNRYFGHSNFIIFNNEQQSYKKKTEWTRKKSTFHIYTIKKEKKFGIKLNNV